MAKRYWLMKTEPTTFSWDDLLASDDETTCWEGVRNYTARNMMRDDFKKGDLAFFYHSSTNPPSIVGIVKVVRTAYPDHTQFDPKSKYYDAKSNPDAPRWIMVDVKAEKPLKRPIPLEELKSTPGLEDMGVVQKGNRLSVQPVTAEEWKIVNAISRRKAPST